MKWHFRSGADVAPALQKTRGNLRRTYEVIVCAGRQGYSSNAISFYENIVLGQEFTATAQDSAAFAFAFDVGHLPRPWDWQRDRAPVPTKSNAVTAQYFRDRAISAFGSSPEVLTMHSFYGLILDAEETKLAYRYSLKAVKLAPKWADAHCWLGKAATNYALTFNDFPQTAANKATKVRLGRLAMRAYDKAEKLNPPLQPYLGLDRANACELIADKKSAQMMPIYVDNYLRRFPSHFVWYKRVFRKDEDQLREQWSRRIASVQKEANQQ